MHAWLVVLMTLLGAFVGSFLNVVIDRAPRGESVVHPRSYCAGCGRTLVWFELVPVFSWLALRGRCRTCGAAIPVRNTLVELGCGVVAGGVTALVVGAL